MEKYDLGIWDVDTQNDFMRKGGALYVPNAKLILPNIKQIIEFGRKHGIPILGSVDAHTRKDAEISDNPNFKTTFPPHCMVGTYGQEKVFPAKNGEIYFEKQTINVFDNPEAEKAIIKTARRYIVIGVATEYCVKEEVLGAQKANRQCYVVTDAIKGITQEGEKAALEEMAKAGAEFVTTKEVLERRII